MDDSVEGRTLEPEPWYVSDTLVGLPTDEMTEGVDATDMSEGSVLGLVTLRGGVESEVSSDVEMSLCWVALSGTNKVWVSLDASGLPISENDPPND